MSPDAACPPPLVSVRAAHALQRAGEALFLDATYFAKSEPQDARESFAAAHLPAARFFDVETIAAPGAGLPHMLPTPDDFARHMAAMGVSNAQHLIIADRPRLRSAPRAWWMLRHFGHARVSVLDGGVDGWIAAGLPVETGWPEVAPTVFVPRVQSGRLVTLPQVVQAAETGSSCILDGRPADRFSGQTGDSWTPRKGHITGSISLPVSTLLAANGRLKPVEELRALLAPVLDARPIITTCGSGIAAATLAFALELIGREDVAVYDGSWAEWGNDPATERLSTTLV